LIEKEPIIPLITNCNRRREANCLLPQKGEKIKKKKERGYKCLLLAQKRKPKIKKKKGKGKRPSAHHFFKIESIAIHTDLRTSLFSFSFFFFEQVNMDEFKTTKKDISFCT